MRLFVTPYLKDQLTQKQISICSQENCPKNGRRMKNQSRPEINLEIKKSFHHIDWMVHGQERCIWNQLTSRAQYDFDTLVNACADMWILFQGISLWITILSITICLNCMWHCFKNVKLNFSCYYAEVWQPSNSQLLCCRNLN